MERRLIDGLVAEIRDHRGRDLTFMEVCGSHTMAAARFGLRELLPDRVRLISGPGCPVCVTPVGYVDHALALAARDDITLTTFGDLMRVPGSGDAEAGLPSSLSTARARGGDVRVVYSPLESLALAEAAPHREVVFLGVGFETTAPGLAVTVRRAAEAGIANFSMLVAAKTIPEAMTLLATTDDIAIDGFLLPGHVSAILGTEIYRPFAEALGLACAVAGFEPLEMLRGIRSLVRQAAAGRFEVDNCYPAVVAPSGNPVALEAMRTVFEPCTASWRGIGDISGSGLALREAYAHFDAARRFEVCLQAPREPRGCRCGDVLTGRIAPESCGLFGTGCTPAAPRGACMVSSEGSCAAAYNYRFLEDP